METLGIRFALAQTVGKIWGPKPNFSQNFMATKRIETAAFSEPAPPPPL